MNIGRIFLKKKKQLQADKPDPVILQARRSIIYLVSILRYEIYLPTPRHWASNP